jgi:hypothetical protein
MNYLTLAMRIKYKEKGEFESQNTWLNIMYYGFGALIVLIPVIATSILWSRPKANAWLEIINLILWIFTVVVMLVALIILYRTLNTENRSAVNVKAVTLHFAAFAIFGAECLYNTILLFGLVG